MTQIPSGSHLNDGSRCIWIIDDITANRYGPAALGRIDSRSRVGEIPNGVIDNLGTGGSEKKSVATIVKSDGVVEGIECAALNFNASRTRKYVSNKDRVAIGCHQQRTAIGCV